MAGGPGDDIKRASAEVDTSYEIFETWTHLFRNIGLVAVVAACTWALISLVRAAIGAGSALIFSGFEDGGGFAFLLLLVVLLGGAYVRGLLLALPSWKSSEGDGMGASLEAFHKTYGDDGSKPPARYDLPDFVQALRRSVLTTLTVGTGGSGGIEAPVVPIGECIGAGWSRLVGNLDPNDLRIMQLAGIAAAAATLLDAPFTAALFAAEIVYNARIIYRTLMYSLISAIVCYVLNNHLLEIEPLFTGAAHSAVYAPLEYFEVVAVALICSAPAGLGVRWLFARLKARIQPIPPIYRPVVGAACAALVAFVVWTVLGLEPRHVLGVSEETIAEVMAADGDPMLRAWWALLLLVLAKALATGFTLMAGGSAGLLVPSMYMGGVMGAAVYYLLTTIGYTPAAAPSLFVVAGLASALCAVVQVPLAAIALVMEVFGAAYGPPAIVSCVLTYKLARRFQLYERERRSSAEATTADRDS